MFQYHHDTILKAIIHSAINYSFCLENGVMMIPKHRLWKLYSLAYHTLYHIYLNLWFTVKAKISKNAKNNSSSKKNSKRERKGINKWKYKTMREKGILKSKTKTTHYMYYYIFWNKIWCILNLTPLFSFQRVMNLISLLTQVTPLVTLSANMELQWRNRVLVIMCGIKKTRNANFGS